LIIVGRGLSYGAGGAGCAALEGRIMAEHKHDDGHGEAWHFGTVKKTDHPD
jgi:hypothetical protein